MQILLTEAFLLKRKLTVFEQRKAKNFFARNFLHHFLLIPGKAEKSF